MNNSLPRRILQYTLSAGTAILLLWGTAACTDRSQSPAYPDSLSAVTTTAGTVTESPGRIALKTLDGAKWRLDHEGGEKGTLLFFLSPECPLCRTYAEAFREFGNRADSLGIAVVGVFPGTFYPEQQIRRYRARYSFDFPMLLDPEYRLTRSLGATITPEAILVDDSGVRYMGALDNWAYEVGRTRPVATEHYLKDALAAVVAGTPVPLERTDAIGCFIE